MSEFLNSIRPHQGDKNGKNSELKYDPQCGMSKGVFEWQCRQFEKVSSRTPELMRDMRASAQKMRVHFKDTEDLKEWDAYERNVLDAYEHDLKTSLGTPVVTPILPPVLFTLRIRLSPHTREMLGRIVLDNYARAFDLQPAQDPSVVIACMTRCLKSLPAAARGVLRLPISLLDSILYDDLMKRKAYSKTCTGLLSTGLNKFKYDTRSLRLVVAGAAIGLAVGLGVGWKQQKINK